MFTEASQLWFRAELNAGHSRSALVGRRQLSLELLFRSAIGAS
jgi:hypothetical protein